jgi:hypothetical protein
MPETIRECALRMLAPEYGGIGERFATFENGDVAAWAFLSEEDVRPSDFEGLKLVVRTNREPRNAIATCVVSAELIRDDESGKVLDMILDHTRRDCERVLVAA